MNLFGFQVATSPMFILMRRRFPLVDTINLNILRLQESRFTEKIMRDVHRNTVVKLEVPKKFEITRQKKLGLRDMEMIGFILVFGYGIAFTAFLLELIVFWRSPSLVR